MNSNATRNPYAPILADLAGTPFAKIVYVEETGSTNADAAARLGSEGDRGLSIVAEHQTQGRGRKGRRWISVPGASLLVTTILPCAVDAAALWAVPFWVALALQRALATSGVPTALHWPNDLLLADDEKLAGILCISRITGDTASVACGVGVNIRRPAPDPQRPPIEPPAAFCDDVTPVDRTALLFALLREYHATLDLLATPGRVARTWEAAAGLPGVGYRFVKDGEAAPFDAVALELAEGGGLVVERAGRLETVSLADARALR